MEDILLLNSIERYLEGQMLPDERSFFEELRRNQPEIDQMVVEHKLFLHQMDAYADKRNFKTNGDLTANARSTKWIDSV